MNLHDVNKGVEKHRKTKRRGRGPGSGQGKTGGRGHKGQRARAGWKTPPTFQGGSMPLVRRVPKRGFHNRFALDVFAINVGDLDALFNNGDEVGIEQLRERGLLRGTFDVLKILGNGEVTKKLHVSAHRFSQSAKEKIEKAGGQVTLVPGRVPVSVKQKRAKEARQAKA